MAEASWICCQLGAREHYAVPRALHGRGLLASLETDVWLGHHALLRRLLPKVLAERAHPELASARVHARNLSAIALEAQLRVASTTGWDGVMKRNAWFQREVRDSLHARPGHVGTLFAYSYAAKALLEHARAQGLRTVLGQIDPGPAEERIVRELHQSSPELAPGWQAAPAGYWNAWREECALADVIMVNSEWSRQLLAEEGVPEAKMHLVPLGFDPPPDAAAFHRTYPRTFSPSRPLRVLFLGQVNLRKGYAAVRDAMQRLEGAPVEFWFVGARQVARGGDSARARWFGAVPRSRVPHFLRSADVLLFPTLSDGFGMTQLEAQAWRLPIIVSGNCARVVRHEENGIVLEEVTGPAIAGAISRLISSPSNLGSMSLRAISLEPYSIASLGERMANLQPPPSR